MQHRKSKRIELVRRTLVYILMVVTTLTLLVILTLTVIGYRFNFSTQQVEQTGLVQYDSRPRGALVMIDGVRYENTQTKGTVLPGQRQFSLQLKGYESWQKTLDIKSGTVTWLNYARMVPTEKKIEDISELPLLVDTLKSPDGKFLVGISFTEENKPSINMIDFRDSRQPKVKAWPMNLEGLSGYEEDNGAKNHNFEIVGWNGSSRYFAVKHHVDREDSSHIEWLLFDREALDGPAVNISTLLGLSINKIKLIDSRLAYVLQDNGDIRRADLSSGDISRPLITGAEDFNIYAGTTIAYTGVEAGNRVAGVWKRDWQQPTVLFSKPEADSELIHIAVSRYFNEDTVAISQAEKVLVYRGNLPSSAQSKDVFLQSSTKFTLNRAATNLQISSNGRFIVAEDQDGMVSYDLERLSSSQEIKKYQESAVSWLDEYHIWQVDDEGYLVMQEFDGMNSHRMMPAISNYGAMITDDNRYMYSLVKADDQSVKLTRLSLTIR